MRELKFRIWDEEENEWLRESDDDALTYYGFSLLGECMLVQSPRKWTVKGVVEQYTGLKDKNGKEIYENDIVKEYDEGLTSIGKVEWDDYNAGFCVVWSGSECVDTLEDGYLTVIGNIHKDMELLI